jgi:hypothetical protein
LDYNVLRRDGTEWAECDPGDLAYDGRYASFTVNGFSSYAVTGSVVPEPGAIVLLLGMAWAVLIRRRKRV